MIVKTLEEFRKIKRFPKDTEEIIFKDHAQIKVEKTTRTTKTLRRLKTYRVVVDYVYENGKKYSSCSQTGRLKNVIRDGLVLFEQRNKQMKKYKERGIDVSL